jgi:hypothetical protein
MAFWLSGSLTADRMKELLKTGKFWLRVIGFIKANIMADVGSTDTRKLIIIKRLLVNRFRTSSLPFRQSTNTK